MTSQTSETSETEANPDAAGVDPLFEAGYRAALSRVREIMLASEPEPPERAVEAAARVLCDLIDADDLDAISLYRRSHWLDIARQSVEAACRAAQTMPAEAAGIEADR